MFKNSDLNNITHLFIDFDGTLVDSHSILYQVYLKFLAAHGSQGTRNEFDSLKGPNIHEIVQNLKNAHQLQADTIELKKQYYHLIDNCYYEAPLFPEAPAALAKLIKAGYKLSIVSAAPQTLISDTLTKFEVASIFSNIFSVQRGELSKPNPAIYKRALVESNIQANQVFAVEDSVHGATSALGAQIKCVFLLNEQAEAKQMIQMYPIADDLIILNNWNEVADFFCKKN